jgi:hypothetical protein
MAIKKESIKNRNPEPRSHQDLQHVDSKNSKAPTGEFFVPFRKTNSIESYPYHLVGQSQRDKVIECVCS